MANDHDPQYPPAGAGQPSLSPSSDAFWRALLGDTDLGVADPRTEFVCAATIAPYPGPAGPEAVFASSMPVHFAPENPTGPQRGLCSETGLGFGSPAYDHPLTYNDPFDAALVSDGPYVSRSSRMSYSSGYGPPQARSEGPPVTASTSSEAQANPSTGLRVFLSSRHERQSTQWRNVVLHTYSIEIPRHCLEPELWERWNGQLYINRSTYDEAEALYLRIDAQISGSETVAPSTMCESCQGMEKKPYPKKAGQLPPQMSNLSRIYCTWPLVPLEKTGDFFQGEISFYIFCHPSHTDGKKCTLQPFHMVATLQKADTRELARFTLAEEIISRTAAKNNGTICSRSAMRSTRAGTVPTPARFANDEGGSENNYPDAPELTSRSVPQIDIPRPFSEVDTLLTTSTGGPPITPSITTTFLGPLIFNDINPNRGYGGQSIKFYGGAFSPTVDYYAKFGELEPTPLSYQNAYLLEGEVPERDKIGPVTVSIVTKEGTALCHYMHRFVYIDHDRKNAEEEIRRAYDKVDPKEALRHAQDATRCLKESKKVNGGCGSPAQAPSTQARRRGTGSGDEIDARDEISKLHNPLEPTSEAVDTCMQVLTNQDEDGNIRPVLFPPSRTWTGVSTGTTTTMVGTTASFKTIKAFSRKPTPQSIVSRWLKSNYGSENSRKRKRTRETEATVGHSGVGGSLVGSINFMLSPEQGDSIEDDLPVIPMDADYHEWKPARTMKRRRMETSLQPLAGMDPSPIS